MLLASQFPSHSSPHTVHFNFLSFQPLQPTAHCIQRLPHRPPLQFPLSLTALSAAHLFPLLFPPFCFNFLSPLQFPLSSSISSLSSRFSHLFPLLFPPFCFNFLSPLQFPLSSSISSLSSRFSHFSRPADRRPPPRRQIQNLRPPCFFFSGSCVGCISLCFTNFFFNFCTTSTPDGMFHCLY